jgi:hypothetical protein
MNKGALIAKKNLSELISKTCIVKRTCDETHALHKTTVKFLMKNSFYNYRLRKTCFDIFPENNCKVEEHFGSELGFLDALSKLITKIKKTVYSQTENLPLRIAF